jgi:hypothetical protein
MSASLSVQRAIRTRLVATPAVVALVPATSILDRHERPAPDPAIIIGEGQEVDEGTSLGRAHVRVFHDLHVWKREVSLEGVKTICGAIRTALHASRLALGDGLHCADWKVQAIRYLRDPGGDLSHGVVTVEVLVSGVI